MLRLVVWLLVLANAGYFAWTQGYLAPLGLAPVDQSEPERLRAQIHPEALRLLNGPKDSAAADPVAEPAAVPAPVASETGPADASATAAEATPATTASSGTPTALNTPAAPPPPATACWQANGFTPAQADALRSALSGSGLPRDRWQLGEVKLGGRWVVYMGRYNDEQIERKKTELRTIGVAFRELSGPLSPGLALGTYSSESAAQQALQDVSQKGVRTARVAQERTETSAWNLRLPEVTDAQRGTVAGLGAALAGKRLQRCN
ncbi:SPOR domain-containing protein [Hydrogenophaga sp.]|uniref:SPOR domain-containing protein n=1 Tax=Hydrogenophaga sp. TaxID=1904254 RepID=UPI00286E7527|nr:SPOR domain-containing protein [Hydrogenophaga sp.]